MCLRDSLSELKKMRSQTYSNRINIEFRRTCSFFEINTSTNNFKKIVAFLEKIKHYLTIRIEL